jgi:hypothetical protein
VNEQTAKLLQKVSEPLRDAPDIFFRRRSARVYNVQVAVDTTHHLIITHEVNVVTDRSQLSSVAKQAKATLQAENLDAIADRGYFSSDEILA